MSIHVYIDVHVYVDVDVHVHVHVSFRFDATMQRHSGIVHNPRPEMGK
jgi:hypothetical protein